VAGSFVALVEAERVDPVEAVHAAPQLRDGRLDDHVVVRRHQAVHVDEPVEAVDAVREETEERDPVDVVAIDLAAVDSERRDMEDPIWELGAQLPRHGRERSAGEPVFGRLWNVRYRDGSKNRSFSADTEGQTLVLLVVEARQTSRRASAALPAARKAAA
jgi:hypothetical protein